MKYKIPYIIFISFLTSSATTACYWQTNRYLQATKKWKILKNQLNKEQPIQLQKINTTQLQPLLYVSVNGKIQGQPYKVDRVKDGRPGYLSIRPLKYNNGKLAVLQGWCPEDYIYKPQIAQQKQYKGLLRQKQKKDYVSNKFKKQDRDKFNINTYINMDQLIEKNIISSDHLSKNYYLQLLKPLNQNKQQYYPYQYSVDNFQLPYLTPDKHLSYACFWGGATLVGITAILKVLRMK